MKAALVRDMSLYLVAVLVLGTAANLLPGNNIAWWGEGATPPREGVDFQWIDPLSADALRRALPSTVFVDTRSDTAFDEARVPGAIRLSYTETAEIDDVERRLRQADAVIVYGDTEEADIEQLLAQELTRRGLAPPSILAGGFEAWRFAGGEVAGNGETEVTP